MSVWKQPIPVAVEGLEGDPFGENLFLYLLRRARREDGYTYIGDYRIELKRGEIAVGRFTLAEAFGMKKNESLRIHRKLKELSTENCTHERNSDVENSKINSRSQKANIYLNIRRHPVCSIVSIINYDEWTRFEQPDEQPVNIRRTSSEHPVNTNKERKNVRVRESNKQIDPKDLSAVPADVPNKFKYTLTMLRADMTEIIGKKFIARKSGAKPSKQDIKDAKALKLRLDEGYERQHFRDALFNIKKEKHHYESSFKWISVEFITRSDKLELYINAGKGEQKKETVKPVVQKPVEVRASVDPKTRATSIIASWIEGIQKGQEFPKSQAYRLGFDVEELSKVDPQSDLSQYVEFYLQKTNGKVEKPEFLKSISEIN